MHAQTGRLVDNSVSSVAAGSYGNPRGYARQCAVCDLRGMHGEGGSRASWSFTGCNIRIARDAPRSTGPWRHVSTLQFALESSSNKLDSPATVERRIHIRLAHAKCSRRCFVGRRSGLHCPVPTSAGKASSDPALLRRGVSYRPASFTAWCGRLRSAPQRVSNRVAGVTCVPTNQPRHVARSGSLRQAPTKP